MPETAELNILIETGTDFVLPHKIKDENGNPLDLTGATVSAQLREFAEAADAFDFHCMHNGSGGRIIVTMPHETTSLIAFRQGVYDVKVILADGTVSHPLSGEAYIKEGVTKSYDGAVLFMLGIGEFDDLPVVGNADRLYFCYSDRKIYRWNGMNYVATSVGNGIQRIELKEHATPFTDIYTIFYDDGTTWDFQITVNGVEYIELIDSTGDYLSGTIDTYRIHFSRGGYYDYDVHGGRVVFPHFDVDWDTGMLYCTDDFSNVIFSIDEETGMLSYSY